MPDRLRADLVLEGGGVKGIGLVGVVERLEARGYHFQKVAGSSAGAVVAALTAAGMPARKMVRLVESLPMHRIADRVGVARLGPVIGPTMALLRHNGVFAGKYLRELIGNLLSDYDVETFEDLRAKGPERELVVTATDVRLGRLVHFPGDYGPVYDLDPRTQLVADAVRASASLPFAFRPWTLEAGPGGEEIEGSRTSVLLDGGILSNFPIDVFDREHDQCPRWPTFGVKILPRLPLPEGDMTVLPSPRLYLRPLSLVGRLVGTLIGGRDQARLDLPWVSARTIRVDTSAATIVDFNIELPVRRQLLDAGRTAAERFLQTWNFREYCRQHRGCEPPAQWG